MFEGPQPPHIDRLDHGPAGLQRAQSVRICPQAHGDLGQNPARSAGLRSRPAAGAADSASTARSTSSREPTAISPTAASDHALHSQFEGVISVPLAQCE
ncbi:MULTISPECIES: hypothetical protein [unclassified Streptomyces]|uniref:hypothetical protein n=1 Tax=unclassified Streptomyces TaxID=2593676 RepID=UPI0036508A0A